MSSKSFWFKLKVLLVVYLSKWKVIHPRLSCKVIPVTERITACLDKVKWDFHSGFKYKKLVDPTGEYRFYVPSLSQDAVFRVDESYGLFKGNLPSELNRIVERIGRRDEKIYTTVFYGSLEELKKIEERLE